MSKQKFSRFLHASRLVLLVIVFLLSTFVALQDASAAVPAGYSEYFIPGGTDQLFALLRDIDNDPELGNANVLGTSVGTCTTGTIPAGGVGPCNYMHNVTTISISSDGVTVYYDHWENGYGSGSVGYDEIYVANNGDVLTFESGDILVPRNAADTCTSSNPNGATNVCYDGRDRLYIAGGAVSVAQAFWPEATGTVFANAWEVYPIKPYQINYTIPVGEDLAIAPFSYTDFNQVFVIVQATQDNTNVQINDPGSGSFNVNLNRGEVTELFHIDAGTTVLATAPVQTQFIVGQPGGGIDSNSRSYTAVPSGLWSSSYYAPVPSFGGGSNTDVFIYNPTTSDLIINYEDNLGNGSVTVPANSTRSYQALTGRYVPTNSALYLESANGSNFWAIGSANTEDPDYNYGFSFIPPGELTNEYFVSWAPGTTNLSANGSPVFVTPIEDNTTIYVDYSPTDGVVDATFTLDRIQMQRVFDPDNNNTGMHIWATNPISIVWGEDASAAAPGNPYIDAGYTILPLNVAWIDAVVTIEKTANPTVIPSGAGQTSEFTLVINSDAFGIDAVTVEDALPDSWAYVDGSSTITLPNGSIITDADADPDVVGQNLTWDNFPVDPLDMNPNETLVIVFSGITTGTPPQQYSINEAVVTGTRGTETFTSSDTATVEVADLVIEKISSAGGTTAPGELITYTINITNIGEATQNNIVLNDPLPVGTTYVANSTVATSGGVTKDNLPFGTNDDLLDGVPPGLVLSGDDFDLPTDGTMTVTFQVVVNTPVPDGQTDVVNTVAVTSDEQLDPLEDTVVDLLPAQGPGDPGDPGNPGGGGGGGNASASSGVIIPLTGFAPGRVTDLSGLPVTKYNSTGDVVLEIPVLKLEMPVVGVPKQGKSWDVNWLLNQAGWLEGSAFPGFSGNSVLTSHVTLSYGQAGPFANLHKLKAGDKVFVHAFGNLYIYEIRLVEEMYPTNPSILEHKDESWLTLVTCAEFDEQVDTYLKRLVVKAELVQAQPERWWYSWP
jgi:LPXTG-site transpeptidase (sortase) family protein